MKSNRILSAILAGLLTASALLASTVLPAAAEDIPTEETTAEETVPQAPPNYVTVAQPTTRIIGDIAVIREINGKAEMEALVQEETKPAAALYTLNQNLQVLDTEGVPFATLDEVLEAHAYRIIPALRIATPEEGEALTTYLTDLGFTDCMIVTADPALMRTVRTTVPAAVGIIDYTETYRDETSLNAEQCLDIRRSVKAHNGTIALLPAHLCTKETVQYLYDRQVNVWTQIPDEPTADEQYHALLSGAVGVISDATDSLLDIACNKLPRNTLTRAPLNIGHRGIPSQAPECTVEGSLLAFEQSANVVEMDVYLSADNRVVVMHNGTTGGTCNADISVEGSTLAQLKELYVNRGWENDPVYSQLRIPTLDEYLEAFKDKDCMLFIEIKSNKREIVAAIRDLVNQYDMYDQCAVITFNAGIMQAMREDYPEMSVGVLSSAFMKTSPSEEALREATAFAGQFNGTLNPSYSDYNMRDVRACTIRGISVYPWTFSQMLKSYEKYFLWGCAGLTGDNADLLRPLTKSTATVLTDCELGVGATLDLILQVTSFDRTTQDVTPTSVIIAEGQELVWVENGTMTVVGEEGSATFLLGYFDPTLEYTIYTQPITITIATEEETTLPVEDTTAAPLTGEDTTPKAEGGCASAVSGVALLIPALLGVALVVRKRKDE